MNDTPAAQQTTIWEPLSMRFSRWI